MLTSQHKHTEEHWDRKEWRQVKDRSSDSKWRLLRDLTRTEANTASALHPFTAISLSAAEQNNIYDHRNGCMPQPRNILMKETCGTFLTVCLSVNIQKQTFKWGRDRNVVPDVWRWTFISNLGHSRLWNYVSTRTEQLFWSFLSLPQKMEHFQISIFMNSLRTFLSMRWRFTQNLYYNRLGHCLISWLLLLYYDFIKSLIYKNCEISFSFFSHLLFLFVKLCWSGWKSWKKPVSGPWVVFFCWCWNKT